MAVNRAEGQKPGAAGYIRLLSVLASCDRFLFPHAQSRQRLHDLHGYQTQADHLAEQAHDVLGVVGAVGVVDDAAALVGLDAVLVDDPVEGGAVAEAVGQHLLLRIGSIR